jgi:hypothetical protein
MFVYTQNRQKLRRVRRREGRYLLRTNRTENDPALLLQYAQNSIDVRFERIAGVVKHARELRTPAPPALGTSALFPASAKTR